MRRLLIVCLVLLVSVPFFAQQTPSPTSVPRLIRFSGTLVDYSNRPLAGTLGVTFSLYTQQQGGSPLWTEVQNVKPDAQGKYTILLGATKANGIPTELFSSGEAQWLGVRVEGQPETARVLMVSVPYALRAAEADTISGHAITDFVTSDKLTTVVREQLHLSSSEGSFNVKTNSTGVKKNAASAGATNFSDTTSNQVVLVTQLGTGSALTASAVSNYAMKASSTSGGALYATGAGNATINAYNLATTGTSYAILGSTASTSGVGFRGTASATSGNTSGVMGDSASPTGTGMYGNSSATTGSGTGVYGRSAGDTAIGVKATAVNTTGATMGLLSTVVSPAGTAAVLRNSGSGKLLSAQSGATNVEILSINGAGDLATSGKLNVAGVATFTSLINFAPSQTFPGATVTTASPITGNGTSGSAITIPPATTSASGYLTSTDWNIFNGKLSPTGSGTGLSGVALLSGGNSFTGNQVLNGYLHSTGFLDSDAFVYAPWGYFVFGDGAAALMFNKSTVSNHPTLYLQNDDNTAAGDLVLDAVGYNQGGECSIDVTGNLFCTGTLGPAVSVGGKKLGMYTMQTPENLVEDFGSGKLMNGVARITIDSQLATVLGNSAAYRIYVTPSGDCEGLYVTNRTATSFEVRELRGGKSSVTFDYRIVGHRLGFETQRMPDVSARFGNFSEKTAAARSASSAVPKN